MSKFPQTTIITEDNTQFHAGTIFALPQYNRITAFLVIWSAYMHTYIVISVELYVLLCCF